jgi:hypothetical protein
MKLNVGIFTPYSVNPILVRLETVINSLKELDYNVEVNSYYGEKRKVVYIFNSLTLWYFDIFSIIRAIPKLFRYDIIYVQDLKLLPICFFAKIMRKKVIYETLDNNVYLHSYYIKNRYKIPFTHVLGIIFSLKEKFFARYFTDIIIVNSKALHKYFNMRSVLLFYTSPFEHIKCTNNVLNSNAYLFLGAFSKAKGAMEILWLVEQTKVQLFLFGDITEFEVKDKISSLGTLIHVTERIESESLKSKLVELLSSYFLFGFSLIKPINYSYATQEANKDIDYLAMGIPIIGNDRQPTLEKINVGCGISFNVEEVKKLLNENSMKETMSKTCKLYYLNNYSYNAYLNNVRIALQKL